MENCGLRGRFFTRVADLWLQRCDSCSALPRPVGSQAHHLTSLGLLCGKDLSDSSLLPPSPGSAPQTPPTALGHLCPPLHTLVPKAVLVPPLPKQNRPPREACGMQDTARGTLGHTLPLSCKEETRCRGQGSPSSAAQLCRAPRRPGPCSNTSLQKSQRIWWGFSQSSQEEVEASIWRGLACLRCWLGFSCACKFVTRQKVLRSRSLKPRLFTYQNNHT